jgi:hypothetical protein
LHFSFLVFHFSIVFAFLPMDALLNNPLAWAHFKIRGGWKNHLWVTGGYVVLITAVITVTARLNPYGAVYLGWTTAMLGLQLAILVLYGCNTIGNAIRRDMTTGLLESHRLMPVTPAAAIFGYISGPTFQAVNLAIANLIIGTTTATIGGAPTNQWFIANGVVALFVAFLWVAIAFASFLAKNVFGIFIGFISFAVFPGGGGLLNLLPGLMLLLSPIMGRSIFSGFYAGTEIPEAYGWSFAAQIAFGVIFYRGAMRRYRRDDIPALGTLLGLLLLAAWVATSAVALSNWSDVAPRWSAGRGQIGTGTAAVIASLVSSMLLGLVPISASARATVDWRRSILLGGQPASSALRPPLSPVLVAILASAISLPIILTDPPRELSSPQAVIRIGLVTLAFFASLAYLLLIFYRAGRRAGLIGVAWVVLTWLIPLAADAFRINILSPNSAEARPLFSLASPLGYLIDLWSTHPVVSNAGLAFQLLLALIPAILFYATEPRLLNPEPP